jgi:tetratricopeptide (TPR) repeat protein
VDKLAIYNHADTSILSGVPEGCIVAVKEPYYKSNGAQEEGDYMICVDHPSDVVLLRFGDKVIPEALRLGPVCKTGEEWKVAGDRAFLEREFVTAVFCYGEAVVVEGGEEGKGFREGVYAKRAGTNLVLGRYDAAREDALRSLTGGKGDWRAWFTAGRAAYGLGEYEVAKRLLEKALQEKPDAAGVKKELARCSTRLEEEEKGVYDFRKLFESLSPTNVHLDVASFLSNTRVGESATHGQGLFATKDIGAGELIFAEKALVMPNQYEPSRASAALYAMMVRQLYDNPSLSSKILPLHTGEYPRTNHEGEIIDGIPVVDVFLTESIRQANCFSAPLSTLEDTKPTTPGNRMAKGLWTHASYMNHSCVPNSMRSFLGDLLISRAVRDIKAGEEIFHQYVPVKAIYDVRQAQFKMGWGFLCQCPLCAAEARGSPDALAKRKDLLAKIEKACAKKPPAKGVLPDSAIRTVDRLAKQLEYLHETEVYDGLPRLALVYPTNWLIEAYRGRKKWALVVRHALRLLREFGFRVSVDEGEDWVPREIYTGSGEASLMTIHVVTALRAAAEAYRALGSGEMAERCEEAGRFGYCIIAGFENDLSVLDG